MVEVREDIEPVELAMLSSAKCAVLVALTELTASGLVSINAGRLYATSRRAQRPTHPLVNAVLEAIIERPGIPPKKVTATVAPHLGMLRSHLAHRGYLHGPAASWMAVPVVLTVFAAIGFGTGVFHPLFIAVLLLPLLFGIACVFRIVSRIPWYRMRVARTREGVDTTRAVYTRYRHLDPRFRPPRRSTVRGKCRWRLHCSGRRPSATSSRTSTARSATFCLGPRDAPAPEGVGRAVVRPGYSNG